MEKAMFGTECIFAHSPEQTRIAQARKDAAPFWRAEDYHRRCFEKNGGACHVSFAELEHQ